MPASAESRGIVLRVNHEHSGPEGHVRGLGGRHGRVEEIDFVVPANQQSGNRALFFNVRSCPDGSGVTGTCGGIGASPEAFPVPTCC